MTTPPDKPEVPQIQKAVGEQRREWAHPRGSMEEPQCCELGLKVGDGGGVPGGRYRSNKGLESCRIVSAGQQDGLKSDESTHAPMGALSRAHCPPTQHCPLPFVDKVRTTEISKHQLQCGKQWSFPNQTLVVVSWFLHF